MVCQRAVVSGPFASCLLRQGRFTDAEAAYRTALKIVLPLGRHGHTTTSLIRTRRGTAIRNQGRFPEAIELYKQALEGLDPAEKIGDGVIMADLGTACDYCGRGDDTGGGGGDDDDDDGALNPFRDGGPFESFEDATGIIGRSAENMEFIGDAQNDRMFDNGFTEKWIGQDPDTGMWYSAFYNPDTGMWAGGDDSPHQ